MDKRMMYALLVLSAAGFGYMWFTNRNLKQAKEQPQDQGPAEVAQNYYTNPPLFAATAGTTGQFYVNQKQTLPLPYNT